MASWQEASTGLLGAVTAKVGQSGVCMPSQVFYHVLFSTLLDLMASVMWLAISALPGVTWFRASPAAHLVHFMELSVAAKDFAERHMNLLATLGVGAVSICNARREIVWASPGFVEKFLSSGQQAGPWRRQSTGDQANADAEACVSAIEGGCERKPSPTFLRGTGAFPEAEASCANFTDEARFAAPAVPVRGTVFERLTDAFEKVSGKSRDVTPARRTDQR